MKNRPNLFILAVTASLLMLSCKKDKTINKSDLESTVTSGSWKITNFNDSGEDETNHFTAYTFTFGDDHVLTATNGSNAYTGTWSISEDNSNDDSSSDLDFNIFLDVPQSSDFEDLNDDWDVESRTDSKIELKDVSGGDGSIDLLTFEK